MGCGKTVLASRVKGHRDLIEDGKSGYLYKLGNRSEFIRKVAAYRAGELKLDTKNIVARYNEFSHENVFDETYETIKRSFVN
jgi:glycosyltransferase involved in cell wall biosynthesis